MNTLIDELTEVAAAPDAEEFHIDSENKANWYLRQVANIDAEVERVKAQAQDIIRSLNADKERLRGRFSAELEQWARQELEGKGRGKTLKLLQGTCAFRTVPGGLRIVDEAAALAYAEQISAAAIIVKRVLDTEVYRKAAQVILETDGELIPGMEVTPERESFSIKFGKGGE